ncbi:MAG: BolA/IbaG family iron-sulfur metabolism protein [Myxococcales bacterium]|nr:BolA/IbaG family iron-sulfur metabolism protein [Myxococcales bacterium]HIK84881.1 BolA/IbaG family iron-sulfur metabolism protein [Myxococcales bacterium]
MALQIINAGPPPEEIAERIRTAIAQAMPEAEIVVHPENPGHFAITVIDAVFEGLSRVKQQQRVYGAIADLMAGPSPPVHAIDRLECKVP